MVVSLGGETHETTTADVGSRGFTGWMTGSMTFTATTASEMLVFLSEGGPTSLPPVALLDGVSLTGGAAPEPGTWAMMGIGFAGLGFARYCRRRRAHAAG
jgi:PEP-CTERM motif